MWSCPHGNETPLKPNVTTEGPIPVSYVWQQVATEGQAPCPRRGHSAVVFQSKMYLFGGCGNRKISNSVFEFTFATGRWRRLECSGDIPCKRYGHTAVVYQNKMVVFGGFKNNGTGLDDTYELDLGAARWRRLQFAPETVPHRRGGHTASVWGQSMLVFGGSHKDSALSVLDLERYRWATLECSGLVPHGRFYHSAAVCGDALYLFGGCWGSKWDKRAPASLDTLARLDLHTKSWSTVECQGCPPEGLSRHTAVECGLQVVLFGGKSDHHVHNTVFIFDTERRCWAAPRVGGAVPPGRYRHTAVVAGDRMVVFGGRAAETYFNDTVALDLRPGSLQLLAGLWLTEHQVDCRDQGLPRPLQTFLASL